MKVSGQRALIGLLSGSGSVDLLEDLLKGTTDKKSVEVGGNNRSVMPLDVPGHTRVTLDASTSISCRDSGG